MQKIFLSGHWWSALAVLVSLSGCQHGSVRKSVVADEEQTPISRNDLFVIAVDQAQRGDLLRAEQYLVAAKAQGLDDDVVVYWLVRVCVAAGRYHSALRHASAHLRSHPGDWGLRLVVASIHEALGDLESARFELETIVHTESDLALPHYRLASVYRRYSVSTEDALRHYRRYLELEPNGPHASESRAELAKGQHDVLRRVDETGNGKQRVP